MHDQKLYDRLVARRQIDGNGCWIWTGAVHSSGTERNAHGRIGIGRTRVVNTHRAMWEAIHGPLPKGVVVCHSCDVPRCINPDHLWLGTQADNLKDCREKGRHASDAQTHCKRGHLLEGDNLKPSKVQRVCRICATEANRRYRAKKRESQATA